MLRMLRELNRGSVLSLIGVIVLLGLLHVAVYEPSEPFYNGDETRHVMTGVFFRDLLADLPLQNLYDYTIDYYLQYPALGLIVWPPVFHFVSGALMLVFGTSFLVPKVAVALFSAAACVFLFLLVRRTHDAGTALLSVLIFGLSPLIFSLSRQVMLEMPTVAFGVASVYFFMRFMYEDRHSDLILCGLLAALTALTRISGVYVLPVLVLLLAVEKKWYVLRKPVVWVTAAVFSMLTLPFYVVTLTRFDWDTIFSHLEQGLVSGANHADGIAKLFYYPLQLVEQVGWAAVLAAVVGIIYSMISRESRRKCWPYLGMIAVTYVLFSTRPLLNSRFVIYWIPGFALFAAQGVAAASSWLQRRFVYFVLATLVVGATAWAALEQERPYVRGYAQAAKYVTQHAEAAAWFLFDGELDGNFIYQVRHQDPARKHWVLRGDKILYDFLTYPEIGYKELASTKADVLAMLFKYDPEFIVVEQPRALRTIAMADTLREVLCRHPERFRLVHEIPLHSNFGDFADVRLQIYRNLFRNAHPEKRVRMEFSGLKRTVRGNGRR